MRVRRHVLDVDLEIDLAASPVTVVFGESGAGKTTLLRCVAGLDRPEPGSRISFDGQTWDDGRTHVPTQRRRVGFLFQNHALFPHLDVDRNVAFGLRHLPRAERPHRVRAALRSAGAEHLSGRPVRQLSGGEAQRVALARALAPQPRLLLLDEPLSALDSPTRTRLRVELRRLLRSAGVPALVVTHDRAEALTLGDQLAVLHAGRLHQLAPVEEVFSRPATAEVARIVETETVAPAVVLGEAAGLTRVQCGRAELVAVATTDLSPGDPVLACVRAEEVALDVADAAPAHGSPRNRLAALVLEVQLAGPLVRVALDAGFPLVAYVTRPAADDLHLRPGLSVTAVVKAPAIHLVPR
nr:ABC transporter ATP-binding protein [Propionibacterium sp.]